jgi:uncharacterized YkwD family protein/spore coat assembly protein SafA
MRIRLFLMVMLLVVCLPLAANGQGRMDSTASTTPDSEEYVVQPGDSLWKIAVKYQVGLREIIDANRQFQNPALIYPLDKVVVPLFSEAKAVEQKVVELVNRERVARGLGALRLNWELARVARIKSADMRDQNYFSHTSPTYGSPFDMIRKFGLTFESAAENIAVGQPTAAEVVKSWMNSPGHRQNILNGDFNEIGVGYVTGGQYRTYWAQLFIRSSSR